jgi:hypothetical protein
MHVLWRNDTPTRCLEQARNTAHVIHRFRSLTFESPKSWAKTDNKGGVLSLLPPGQAGTSQISNHHSSIANQRILAGSPKAYQGRTTVGRGFIAH